MAIDGISSSHRRSYLSQVTKAVIAVPAKFNSRQKRATGEAYMRAGLKVIRKSGRRKS